LPAAPCADETDVLPDRPPSSEAGPSPFARTLLRTITGRADVTTALRTRRSLAGAALASAMCTGLLTMPAAAATQSSDVPPPTPDPAQNGAQVGMSTDVAAPLAEPSHLLSATTGDTIAWPVKGRLSSEFGPRGGRLHRGIDIAATTGTPIRAAQDGTVRFAGWKGGYGYTIDIAHGGGLTTRAAHQSELLARHGQRVRRGQIIGRVGSTGSSTGPHLHFEIAVHGDEIDPLEILPARRDS
jgi:murein DD-endopeptidase MepM/ murein hydrolase activator NlpD